MAKKTESPSMLLKIIALIAALILLLQIYQIFFLRGLAIPSNGTGIFGNGGNGGGGSAPTNSTAIYQLTFNNNVNFGGAWCNSPSASTCPVFNPYQIITIAVPVSPGTLASVLVPSGPHTHLYCFLQNVNMSASGTITTGDILKTYYGKGYPNNFTFTPSGAPGLQAQCQVKIP